MGSGPTDIQKQQILALIEYEGELNDFQLKFLETMEKMVENNWQMSTKQAAVLEKTYDEKILGNKTGKDRYVFGPICVQKGRQNEKLWELWIIDQPYGEEQPRNDLLVVASWLSKNLEHIALDVQQDPDFVAKLSADVERLEEMKKEQEKEDNTDQPDDSSEEINDDGDDDYCPF